MKAYWEVNMQQPNEDLLGGEGPLGSKECGCGMKEFDYWARKEGDVGWRNSTGS